MSEKNQKNKSEEIKKINAKNSLKFEEALKRLEEIVKHLESSEVSLEESITLFEEGIRLSKYCSQKLEEAEQRITKLIKTDSDEFQEIPFEETESNQELS
ncbi:MAG: exodeoxyribonuclease VII small subunit [bacterium]|nr:exodeoxyribonuclease VII small subunit [bacterium]